jgi:hypothetical protein
MMIPVRSRVAVLTAAALALCAVCLPANAASGSRARHHRPPAIQGAWELVFPEPAAHQREVKLITRTHFSWTAWDTQSHAPLGSGGGSYALDGDAYHEQLLFASGGAEGIAGTVQSFHVWLKGDSLFQSRAPRGGGGPLEIWKRLR